MGNMGCKYAEMILEGQAHGLELAAVTRINKNDAERMSQLLPENVPVFYDENELLAYDEMDAVIVEKITIPMRIRIIVRIFSL